MQKRKYLFITVLAGLLAVLLAVVCLTIYLYVQRQEVQRQERLDQRYHLLCEVLQPGMSKNEVLKTLEQVGEFAVAGEKEDPSTPLHIVFTNPKEKEIYGAFDIDFSDDKYIRASVFGFDSQETICNFVNQSNPQP